MQFIKDLIRGTFPGIYFRSRKWYYFFFSKDGLLNKVVYRLTKKLYFHLKQTNIEVVGGCQLKCVGCPHSSVSRKITFMSVNDFNECMKNIDVAHIELLRLFNFGESLLHPNLATILMQIPKQSFTVGKVGIHTNGQHFNEERLIAILKTGVLSVLTVSCDGNGTPEEFERLRPPAKWDVLLHFLVKVKELRDKHAPNITLRTETICGNVEEQARWKKIMQPLGWEPQFRSFKILSGAVRNMDIESPNIPEGICTWVHPQRLFVDCECNVIPCCAHPQAFIFGNLKTQKYGEILFGEKRKLFLRKAEKRREMPICKECGEPEITHCDR